MERFYHYLLVIVLVQFVHGAVITTNNIDTEDKKGNFTYNCFLYVRIVHYVSIFVYPQNLMENNKF